MQICSTETEWMIKFPKEKMKDRMGSHIKKQEGHLVSALGPLGKPTSYHGSPYNNYSFELSRTTIQSKSFLSFYLSDHICLLIYLKNFGNLIILTYFSHVY